MFGNGNWEQRPLGEVGTFKRGGGFQKSDYVEHGIPCIHYGQIHTLFGPFIYSHISEISSELESKTKFASKGDLIIAITSEDAEGSCKSTAWLGAYPVAVGAHAAIYSHCMNPLYMSFFFKSELFNHAKMEYIHGTKVVEIRPDDIAKILVPCPPMSMQDQFSTIAHQADKSKFSDFKSRFIEECYSRYPKQKLGGHISVIRGVSYKPSDVRSSVDEEVAIILRSNNIADGEINFDDLVYVVQERVQNEQKLKPGDIVMCGSNGSISLVGKAGLLKDNMPNTAFGAFCLGIKCKETILPEYLNTYFNTQVYRSEIESMGNGTNIINIRPDNITNLFIPIPPVEKQMAFVEVVNQADKSKYLN